MRNKNYRPERIDFYGAAYRIGTRKRLSKLNLDFSEPIPEYDREMKEFVRNALKGKSDQDIVAEIGANFVTKQHVSTLEGIRWLDGEVMI